MTCLISGRTRNSGKSEIDGCGTENGCDFWQRISENVQPPLLHNFPLTALRMLACRWDRLVFSTPIIGRDPRKAGLKWVNSGMRSYYLGWKPITPSFVIALIRCGEKPTFGTLFLLIVRIWHSYLLLQNSTRRWGRDDSPPQDAVVIMNII